MTRSRRSFSLSLSPLNDQIKTDIRKEAAERNKSVRPKDLLEISLSFAINYQKSADEKIRNHLGRLCLLFFLLVAVPRYSWKTDLSIHGDYFGIQFHLGVLFLSLDGSFLLFFF
ncbi:hypothetical protein NPIL_591991 [Nephila pilipes]|uniref:Uncharacterized protein n=1 Tax=Nephila pilipes TaxID=299642 RepID=A0A8X6PMM0_NEPPI|nr:hypothetical protein NPIL_591991 [Nephila pilipes]